MRLQDLLPEKKRATYDIRSTYINGQVVLEENEPGGLLVVIHATPEVQYMVGWHVGTLRSYTTRKQWICQLVG